MAEVTAEKVAQLAFNMSLLDERQLAEAWGQFGRRNVQIDDFLQFLLRRGFLTNWQVDRLLKGERSGYFCGDYKLQYLAGTGTFSRVYRAVHRNTGDMVAVKVLRRRFSEDPVQADQFVREGKLGLQLRHPNIVPIYEVYSKDTTHWLAMEFIEGQNLRDFVKVRKKLPPLEATRMIAGIVSGLSYAFEKGVSHRDMKLTNVLVSSHGQPKVVDFGLSGIDESKNADLVDKPNPRTVDYVALERATGVKKDDGRSDIFFLGCIYYHMLTGNAALHETKDRLQRLSKQRFLDVVPITQAEPNLPRVVSNVVLRAMELSPSLRYQKPSEMLAELTLAERRLTEGTDVAESHGQDAESLYQRWEAQQPQAQKTLMLVESNLQMQDALRTGLKRSGYRVLVTRDPQWALSRFFREPTAADGVVFSTVELGEPALEAFNEMATNEDAARVPAVLLLGEGQQEWQAKAQTGDHRVVINSPIKLRDFRAVLQQLLHKEANA